MTIITVEKKYVNKFDKAIRVHNLAKKVLTYHDKEDGSKVYEVKTFTIEEVEEIEKFFKGIKDEVDG